MHITAISFLVVLVLALTAPSGHAQDAKCPSLQAESYNSSLFLTVKNLTWEKVYRFGWVVKQTKDITSEVREALTDSSMQMKSSIEGFSLDFGPYVVLGDEGHSFIKLTFLSGQVATAVLPLSRTMDLSRDSPLKGLALQEPPLKNLIKDNCSSNSPFLEFTREEDRLIMTVMGATWSDVKTITLQYVESYNHTSELQDALASGTAQITPIGDGFFLEIHDANTYLPEEEWFVALLLETGELVEAAVVRR